MLVRVNKQKKHKVADNVQHKGSALTTTDAMAESSAGIAAAIAGACKMKELKALAEGLEAQMAELRMELKETLTSNEHKLSLANRQLQHELQMSQLELLKEELRNTAKEHELEQTKFQIELARLKVLEP